MAPERKSESAVTNAVQVSQRIIRLKSEWPQRSRMEVARQLSLGSGGHVLLQRSVKTESDEEMEIQSREE